MPEVTRVVALSNKYGLHARPASRLVGIANRYRAAVTITLGGRAVNAKSIMEVLTLAATAGSELTIRGDGEDADQAVSEIAALVDGKFGEE